LLNKASLTDTDLYAILEQVYEHVMHCKSDLAFLAAFEDYRLKHVEFSDERMGLELMKSKFAAEVCSFSLFHHYFHIYVN